MTDSLAHRVQQLGLSLPTPSQPIANYVNHVVSQNPVSYTHLTLPTILLV